MRQTAAGRRWQGKAENAGDLTPAKDGSAAMPISKPLNASRYFQKLLQNLYSQTLNTACEYRFLLGLDNFVDS